MVYRSWRHLGKDLNKTQLYSYGLQVTETLR